MERNSTKSIVLFKKIKNIFDNFNKLNNFVIIKIILKRKHFFSRFSFMHKLTENHQFYK